MRHWIMVLILGWSAPAGAAIAPSVGAAQGPTNIACGNQLSRLYLSGSFVMPQSGEKVNLRVGKVSPADKQVQAFISGPSNLCEASCRVTHFERFLKDMKPALMEFDCQGSRLRALRMPLHIQWVRGAGGFETNVRLGSSLFGVEQAGLQIEVNRY